MNKNQKLARIQELSRRLDTLDSSDLVKQVKAILDEPITQTASDTPTAKALLKLTEQLKSVSNDTRAQDALDEIKKTSEENAARFDEVRSDYEARIKELSDSLTQAEARGGQNLSKAVGDILVQLSVYEGDFNTQKQTVSDSSAKVAAELQKLRDEINSVHADTGFTINELDTLDSKIEAARSQASTLQQTVSSTQADLEDFKQEARNRINNIPRGGNANRNIALNGNGSVLSLFTDINWKAGNNVTLTASPNQTTKYTDITIAASGGAGGNPAGSDTQVQFNDNGSFGATDGLTFNKNTSILTASIISGSTETLTVPSAWPTRGLDITNNSEVNALRITQVGSITASRSIGGGLLVSNGTTNTGNAAVFYSNVASALGRIVHITADNVSFDKEALYVESDSTSTTALGVIGAPKGQGVIKVTHSGAADGSDANGAGISIDIATAGTAAQGLFINATSSTTGNLIVARNAGANKFVVAPTGVVTVNNAYSLPTADGSANFVLTTDGAGNTLFASVAATGGSGITRTASVITANTLGGNGAAVDYVYIATNSLNFTLPNPSGNTNLYTLKNATNSSVVVTAVGGKTIDGSGSVLVAINNQSLDFISDNTNYRII